MANKPVKPLIYFLKITEKLIEIFLTLIYNIFLFIYILLFFC